jgi:hypothetical protein
MTPLRRLLAAACGAAMILAAAEALAAEWPARRLIVVIWERRAPETENGIDMYGATQRKNRETLLELLYDRQLASIDPRHTSIAIYPEGLPANDENSAAMYGALTDTPTERLGEVWLPRMLSLVDPGDPVRPLFWQEMPRRDEMSGAIRGFITNPLTGATPFDSDESLGKPVETATRAISHPPLVTPYALYNAADRFGLRNQPFSEVYVVWVHAGERNYAITIPQRAIRRDYGEACATYYLQARKLYVLEPDETRNADGELADGNITVWHVKRRVAAQQPVAPRLMWRGRPASFDRRKATLDVSMLHPDIGARLREAYISLVRFVSWNVEYPDPRLKAIEAVATMPRSGLTYRLPKPDAPIPIGRIVDDTTRRSGALSFSDTLQVEARFDDAEPLPPHLQQIALRIPIVLHTNTAPITFEITPWPAQYTVWGLWAIGILLAYALLRWILRFRRRSLAVHVQWDSIDPVAIHLKGPSTEHEARFRFWLLDQSSYGPPWLFGKVKMELATTASITELPLRKGIARAAMFVDAKKDVKRMKVRASRSPRGSGTPVELRVLGSAIDFTRLRAGRDLRGFYTFTIHALPSVRYRDALHAEAKEYRVKVEAFQPKYVVSTTRLAEIEQRELFFDPKLSESVTERQIQIGWLFVDNPTTAAGPALDIIATPLLAEATIDSHRVDATAIPSSGDPSQANARIRNAGQAQWDLFVTIPSIADWTEKTEWQIRVHVVVAVRVDGEPDDVTHETTLECTWYPVDRHNFICLDLGTSATRLLVQSVDDARFGFLPFPQGVRGNLAGPEELPSMWSLLNGKILFGNEALLLGRNKHFRTSVKQRLLDDRSDAGTQLRDYIKELMNRFYLPEIEAGPPETMDADVIRPDSREGSVDVVTIERGRRHLAVCTIPNEAPPALISAYRDAMNATKRFRRVLLLREAEAVAFDFIDQLHRRGGPRQSLRVIALDVGAGTSDVAMVAAELPAGQAEPTAKVIAAAGAAKAGDSMDRAIFEFLAASGRSVSMPRDFSALSPSEQWEYLRECDTVKRAIAAGRGHVNVKLPNSVDLDHDFLDDLYLSAAYQNALTDIVDGPVQMLLGRLPADAGTVTHLLLTGRGSLIKGVEQRFRDAVAPIVAKNVRIEQADGNAGLLKAAVSLGARSYVRKQWASLTLTEDFFPDRVVVIGVHDAGTERHIAVDAGTRYDNETHAIEREVPMPWNRWSKALVVRTYLRTDDRVDKQLQMDPATCGRIVAGDPIGVTGRAYKVVKQLNRPDGDHARDWKIGIHVSPAGTVTAKELAQ